MLYHRTVRERTPGCQKNPLPAAESPHPEHRQLPCSRSCCISAAVLNKRLLPHRLGELGRAVRAGAPLAEVAVFLQEQLQERTRQRSSSEHALGSGGKGRCSGKQRCKPRAVQRFPVVLLPAPQAAAAPAGAGRMGPCVCTVGPGETSPRPVIFDGSWVFGSGWRGRRKHRYPQIETPCCHVIRSQRLPNPL